jgi:hypothetical protein
MAFHAHHFARWMEKTMTYQHIALSDAESPGKHVPANRRASVRYQCGPATPGRIMVAEAQEWQRAWVIDLSLDGVGLLLNRDLEPGTDLVVALKSGTANKTFELAARVCHTARQPDGDWLIGCEFATRLTDDDLDCLL